MRKIFGICPVIALCVLLLCPAVVFADEVPEPVMTEEQQAALAVLAEQHAALAAQQQEAIAAQQQAALTALAEQQAALAAQQEAALRAIQEAQAAAAAQAEKEAKEAAEIQRALAAQDAAMQAASSGMTYVDISIDNQILTYFVNGTVALTTPCVSGGPKNSTPRGVFAINSMVPGKYLTGPDWHVWVNRWMRFCGNCGIHDASWRKSFGGEIYKRNGSHGCVNIPSDKANQLYGMVGLGTMVIVH